MAYLINKHTNDTKNGITIGNDWLAKCLKNHFNLIDELDVDFINNYCTHFVKKLTFKRNDKTGALGASKSTICKYKTIQKKIQGFEKSKKKKYKLIEINLNFRNEFLKYLLETEKLGRNTAGRYLKFLKTICLDAQKSGHKVSAELSQIKGFSVAVEKIYLSFSELEQIENTNLKGRWQILQEKPKVICDTAHNKEGLSLVLNQLKREKYQHLHVVLGVVSDKDLDEVLPLFPKEATYYFCKPNIPRGLSEAVLQEKAANFNLLGKKYTSVKKAYKAVLKMANHQDLIYIGGSTFVVAEVI